MKRLSILLLTFLFLTITALPVHAAAAPIQVYVDEEKLTFPIDPLVTQGTTLVPFRVIFEKFGLKVNWDQETKTVTGEKEDMKISFQLGQTKVFVNGEEKEFIVAPTSTNGHTLVPLRFISETLGMEVGWEQTTSTITISTTPTNPVPTNPAPSKPKPLTDKEYLDMLPDVEDLTSYAFTSVTTVNMMGMSLETTITGETILQPNYISHTKTESKGMAVPFSHEAYIVGKVAYAKKAVSNEWVKAEIPADDSSSLLFYNRLREAVENVTSTVKGSTRETVVTYNPTEYDKLMNSEYKTKSVSVTYVYSTTLSNTPNKVITEGTYDVEGQEVDFKSVITYSKINEIKKIPLPAGIN